MRKLISAIAVTSTLAFSIVGCGDGPSHDVSWYKAHDTERLAELERCHNNPGDIKNAPSCINAIKAAKQLSQENFKLTPLPRYNKDLLGRPIGKDNK